MSITTEGYTTWSASTPELGRLPHSPNNLWTGLRLTPAGTAFFGISQNGELRFTEATELLSGAPIGSQRGLTTLPGFPTGQVKAWMSRLMVRAYLSWTSGREFTPSVRRPVFRYHLDSRFLKMGPLPSGSR